MIHSFWRCRISFTHDRFAVSVLKNGTIVVNVPSKISHWTQETGQWPCKYTLTGDEKY